jgi:hypothetical protein
MQAANGILAHGLLTLSAITAGLSYFADRKSDRRLFAPAREPAPLPRRVQISWLCLLMASGVPPYSNAELAAVRSMCISAGSQDLSTMLRNIWRSSVGWLRVAAHTLVSQHRGAVGMTRR